MEEEKDRKLSCNVTILDRKFKYTVPAEDESLIRNTIRGVSDKLAELRSRKNFNDNQELLTVALVQVALEKARLENLLGEVSGDIRLLDSQLGEYIDNNAI